MDFYAAIDRFVSKVGDKYNNAVRGKLISKVGAVRVDEWGRELSLFIRQRKSKKPHVHFSFANGGEGSEFEIPCNLECAEQLERLAQEMRKQIDLGANEPWKGRT